MLELEKFGLFEMSSVDVQKVDGGFIPIVVLGVTYAAPTVAAWCCGALAGGIALGAAAYLAGR